MIQQPRLIRSSFTLLLSFFIVVGWQSVEATSKRATKNQSKRQVSLLRPREVRALKPQQKARYYRELHKVLVTLERRQKTKRGRARNAAVQLWLQRAFAENEHAREDGSACLMGGYFGRWSISDGQATCADPEPSQIWESDTGEFECGVTPSGEKKAYCNSAFFLYGSDSQQRFCEPATNLVANCAKKFEERYLNPSSMNRLVADTSKLMNTMGAEEIEAYYQDLEGTLDDMIGGEDDAATARLLKKQLGLLNGFKSVAQKAALTEPAPAPASENSRLLGDELSCIRNGLRAVGLHPSEKYLAFLGVGLQAFRGPFKTNDPESLRHLRAATISMVQAYGVCSESAYPSTQDSREISLIRNLLTAGNGQVTMTGFNYIGSAVGADPASRAKVFFDLFGLKGVSARNVHESSGAETDDRALQRLFPDANTWQAKNLVDRQRTFRQWLDSDGSNQTSFGDCRTEARKAMTMPNSAFNIESLNRDNRRAAVQAAASNAKAMEALYQVSAENLKVCAAMADACGLDADPVCDARNLVRPPGTQKPMAPPRPPPALSK